MLIAAYALQVRHAFVYIRGEFDLPYRRLPAALEEAYAAGYFGERILGTDFACDIVDLSRRRLVRMRRSVGADHVDRGQARLSAQPAAAPDRARPVPAADRRQQRRDAVEHRRGSSATARDAFKKRRHREEPGHAPDLDLGPHQPAGRLRDRDRLPVGEVHLRGLRRHPRRARAEGHHPRRHLDQGADRRRDRAARIWTTRRSTRRARRSARAA